MTQPEAFHCLLSAFKSLDRDKVDFILNNIYKTNIDFVLKSASPETVYGALHEWNRWDKIENA